MTCNSQYKVYLDRSEANCKVELMKREQKQAARRHLDEQLTTLRELGALAVRPRGWIRAYRDALGMTAAQLGGRMGISGAAVAQLEASEVDANVNVASLQRAAEAMDATVHFVFIPNTSLEETVQRRAREVARSDLETVDHSMRLEDQAVDVGAAERLLQEHIEEVLDSRRLWARDR